ncbi:MAG: hypothetical protein AB1394_11030 [Bacteroidota bacterium]|jgi:hypothetical protein
METTSVYIIFFVIYSIIWISLLIGLVLMRNRNKFSERLHEIFVKRQIQKFQYPPFKNLLKLWISNKFLITSINFIIMIIIPAVIMFFLLGILLLSPFLAIIQGFTVGNLISNFKSKEMTWAILVGIFEFGYWALSGALGISVTAEYLLFDKSFFTSLSIFINNLYAEYWLPLTIFICGNAFGEVSGPIYFNIKSPISLTTLSKGFSVNENT